jgi:hypothetical protein
LGDELTAHFSGAEAGRHALGAKLWSGLTLAIDDSGDILKEVRPVDFSSLTPPRAQGIETDAATVEFMGAFANGDAIPAQFAFGPALPTGAEFLDRTGHKETAGAACERRGRVDKQGLE